MLPFKLLLLAATTFAGLLPRTTFDYTLCDDDQVSFIEQFQLDGVILANYTLRRTLIDGTSFKLSPAFRNYFEPEDYDKVMAMYRAIDDFFWKYDAAHHLWSLCGNPIWENSEPLTCLAAEEAPFAYADPDPTGYAIGADRGKSGFGFCRKFFDPETKESHVHFNAASDEEWCKGETFKDFLSSGFYSVILFTQTNTLASIAGIPTHKVDHSVQGLNPREETAGTVAIMGYKPWETARLIKQQWDKVDEGGPKPTVFRIQNAAAFAAAATEWYFSVKCGKTWNQSIPP